MQEEHERGPQASETLQQTRQGQNISCGGDFRLQFARLTVRRLFQGGEPLDH